MTEPNREHDGIGSSARRQRRRSRRARYSSRCRNDGGLSVTGLPRAGAARSGQPRAKLAARLDGCHRKRHASRPERKRPERQQPHGVFLGRHDARRRRRRARRPEHAGRRRGGDSDDDRGTPACRRHVQPARARSVEEPLGTRDAGHGEHAARRPATAAVAEPAAGCADRRRSAEDRSNGECRGAGRAPVAASRRRRRARRRAREQRDTRLAQPAERQRPAIASRSRRRDEHEVDVASELHDAGTRRRDVHRRAEMRSASAAGEIARSLADEHHGARQLRAPASAARRRRDRDRRGSPCASRTTTTPSSRRAPRVAAAQDRRPLAQRRAAVARGRRRAASCRGRRRRGCRR